MGFDRGEHPLQEPRLTFKTPFLTPPRSPRLHNPDQFRRGERYPSCKPDWGVNFGRRLTGSSRIVAE